MVFVKKWPYFHLFLKSNYAQKNVSYDILQQRNAFLGNKHKKFKKSKNWHFSKGFPQKLVIFPTFFFLDNIGQENVFYDILEQNNAFLGKKTRNWKPRKIDIFLKGLTHGFAQKLAIFPTFFFRQYRPGNCVLWYSRTKKRLSRQ